ncbi:hypothetical protein P9112_009567 [Eukaryota sp. TZLM1-RC]
MNPLPFDVFSCTLHSGIITNPVKLKCGHSFCKQCIQKWINDTPTCPTCGNTIVSSTQPLPINHALNRTLSLLLRPNIIEESDLHNVAYDHSTDLFTTYSATLNPNPNSQIVSYFQPKYEIENYQKVCDSLGQVYKIYKGLHIKSSCDTSRRVISHSKVVKLYGISLDQPGIIQEALTLTLKDFIQLKRTLTLTETFHVSLSVSDAVSSFHKLGFGYSTLCGATSCHDITSDNVFVLVNSGKVYGAKLGFGDLFYQNLAAGILSFQSENLAESIKFDVFSLGNFFEFLFSPFLNSENLKGYSIEFLYKLQSLIKSMVDENNQAQPSIDQVINQLESLSNFQGVSDCEDQDLATNLGCENFDLLSFNHDLISIILQLNDELCDKRCEIEDFSNEKRTLNAKIKELEHFNNEISANKNLLSEENQQLGELNAELSARLDELQKQLETAEKEKRDHYFINKIENLKWTQEQLKKSVSEKQQKIQILEQEISQLSLKNEQLNQSKNSEISCFSQQVQQLTQINTTLESQNQYLESTLDKLTKYSQNLKSKNEYLTALANRALEMLGSNASMQPRELLQYFTGFLNFPKQEDSTSDPNPNPDSNSSEPRPSPSNPRDGGCKYCQNGGSMMWWTHCIEQCKQPGCHRSKVPDKLKFSEERGLIQRNVDANPTKPNTTPKRTRKSNNGKNEKAAKRKRK